MSRIMGGFCLAILTLVLGCSSNALSPEDEIRQFIETGVQAAEDRNSSDLAELIASGYQDEKGYDKKQLEKISRLYFFRHKNIYLLTKIDEIDFVSANEARVTLHVAMAGSAISDTSLLSSLRARIYKFELQLIKDEEWLLHEADWQPASVGDMQSID